VFLIGLNLKGYKMIQIRKIGDPVLSKVCEPISSVQELQDSNVLKIMKRAMLTHPTAVGLAAPQVGFSKRIIMVRYRGFWKTMVNPKILSSSIEINSGEESCLSCPGVSIIVPRHNVIQVDWVDKDFNYHADVFDGKLARIIQHEIHHLNGRMITFYGEKK